MPTDLSSTELDRCVALVTSGGAVTVGFAQAELPRASVLAIVRRKTAIVGSVQLNAFATITLPASQADRRVVLILIKTCRKWDTSPLMTGTGGRASHIAFSNNC